MLQRQLQGRGCQIQVTVERFSLGSGRNKAKQPLAALGLAEMESEQERSCSPWENKQEQGRRRQNPRPASRELNLLSRARCGFVRMPQSTGDVAMQQSGPNSEAGSHPPQPSPAATSPGPSLFLLTLPPSPGTAQEESHPSIQPGHICCQSHCPWMPPASVLLASPSAPSCTYTGHTILPNTSATPHPTHAKVVQGAHLCHGLKHCTVGDAVRDQPFAAPQC